MNLYQVIVNLLLRGTTDGVSRQLAGAFIVVVRRVWALKAEPKEVSCGFKKSLQTIKSLFPSTSVVHTIHCAVRA